MTTRLSAFAAKRVFFKNIVYTRRMRNLLKKTAVFAIIFMIGAGNLAYAASAGSCKMIKVSVCCQSAPLPCECKITAKKLFPQAMEVSFPGFFLRASGFTEVKNFTPDSSAGRCVLSFQFPPGQIPLYTLHSSYRI